jgi:hypothetical protein
MQSTGSRTLTMAALIQLLDVRAFDAEYKLPPNMAISPPSCLDLTFALVNISWPRNGCAFDPRVVMTSSNNSGSGATPGEAAVGFTILNLGGRLGLVDSTDPQTPAPPTQLHNLRMHVHVFKRGYKAWMPIQSCENGIAYGSYIISARWATWCVPWLLGKAAIKRVVQ